MDNLAVVLKKYSRKDLQMLLKSDTISIDLGCGSRKKDGTIGVDIYRAEGVDIVCNLNKGLPFQDNSVDRICADYFLEHVDNLIFMFQEMYRILVDGGIVEALVPYYSSINAFKDPTHKNFFTEETFKYFSRDKWYGSDYGINTNFELIDIKYSYSNLIRWLPFKKYLRRYLFNVVGAMEVKLKAVKS